VTLNRVRITPAFACTGHAGSLLSLRYSRQHELAQRTLILERQRGTFDVLRAVLQQRFDDGPGSCAQDATDRNSVLHQPLSSF
jgi:hypothetical protein